MIIFEAVNRCTPDPTGRPIMHEKGFRLYLEPDKYVKHAQLADRLRRLKSWVIVSPKEPGITKSEIDEPISDGLLPHQRLVLERLRAK